MKRFLLLFLLLSSMFLTQGIFVTGQVQGQSQNNYSLGIQGRAWDKLTINILVITPSNASWWIPSDLDATLRAIGQWNDAIQYFSSHYAGYAYLSSLNLQPTVSNVTEPGYNIYLNWTEFTLDNTSNELGLESTVSKNGIILNDTISLATHTSHGDALTIGDMQNVALHELGHSLGLGHCNDNSGDVMYPDYTMLSPAELLSTLDVYGVATVFAWTVNQSAPVEEVLNFSSVVLPSNIPYSYLPVSSQNARPETLADNSVVQTLVFMIEILIHPEILAAAIIFISVMIILVLLPSKKKRTS